MEKLHGTSFGDGVDAWTEKPAEGDHCKIFATARQGKILPGNLRFGHWFFTTARFPEQTIFRPANGNRTPLPVNGLIFENMVYPCI
ncbi:hypothetical protein [Geomobilimonas luticola]|uniref:Uncharacterized protein n=1 Tax=Geomobilimonas luticola TaxID=1114878 RepID=A0ABS5S9R7_9BACT|nr:hypothetical protein [Geomobilimonas luticola]MBT0652121.1 hypothetical protein [Geomobilimonas luticola]